MADCSPAAPEHVPEHVSEHVPEHPTLPVPTGLGRGLVLASVFVCAACGLVYELELVALASYLAGDSVTQASVVLSSMVFAMGLGSLLAKRLRVRAASGFGAVEALLALVGGGSAIALYAGFAWFGQARVPLVVFSLAIGALTGAEMPLLMTLIQRIRRQDAGGAVADLFAADYVGALVGGLTFPFLLLPFLGQLTGALLTGVVNALAGGVVVLWLFRRDVSTRVRWWLLAVNGAVIVALLVASVFVPPFERAARRAVYGEHVRVVVHTDDQDAVLTGAADPSAYQHGGAPLELYLDGRLRACSADRSRYHEALVHPAMANGPFGNVLILGGGDGLALHQVLRYPGVRRVTVVAADPAVPRLARTDRGLRRLGGDAYGDPRVRLVTGDPFRWMRGRVGEREGEREGSAVLAGGGARTGSGSGPELGPGSGGGSEVPGPYDVIVSDLPDPSISEATKLYSQEFYGLAVRALAPHGRLVVHAGSTDRRPRNFWTVESTLRAAGLHTTPYDVGARSGGCVPGRSRKSPGGDGESAGEGAGASTARDWGFVLAARRPGTYATTLPAHSTSSRVRSLTPQDLRSARNRAERHRIPDLPGSTLMHPRY